MYDATYTFTIYRDLPAALEAYERGDPAPLLRLAAEDSLRLRRRRRPAVLLRGRVRGDRLPRLPDDLGPLGVRGRAPPAARGRDRRPGAGRVRAVPERRLPAHALGGPARGRVPPLAGARAGRLADADAPGPHSDVPVLVLDGELDITTPLANASDAAAAWPNATLVPVANEIHISALYDYERCASRIVRRFVSDVRRRGHVVRVADPEDQRRRVVPRRGRRRAAGPKRGTERPVDRTDRRVAWAAVETVADAFNRWWNELFGGTGVGLRGGSYEMRGPFYRWDRPLVLTFDETRFVADVAVSGTVVWHRRAGDGDRPSARRGSGRLRDAAGRVRHGPRRRRHHRARERSTGGASCSRRRRPGRPDDRPEDRCRAATTPTTVRD